MLGFGFMFGKNNKRNEFGFKFFTFLVNETSRFKVSILTNMFIGSRCIFCDILIQKYVALVRATYYYPTVSLYSVY